MSRSEASCCEEERMKDIENLIQTIRFYMKMMINEGALEIAHTTLATL